MRVISKVVAVSAWIGLASTAAFAGSGIGCTSGHLTGCEPQTWALVAGVAVTVGLGVAGAALWKPQRKRPEPRFPWQYPR